MFGTPRHIPHSLFFFSINIHFPLGHLIHFFFLVLNIVYVIRALKFVFYPVSLLNSKLFELQSIQPFAQELYLDLQ